MYTASYLVFLLYLKCYLAQSLFKTGDPKKVLKASRTMCMKYSEDPYFDPSLLLGASWRIYYTWNLKVEKCMDMKFKMATPMVRFGFAFKILTDLNPIENG